MLLDLKKVFLNEDEKTQVTYNLDLSTVKIDGICPMSQPVEVCALAENRAGIVKLTTNVKFDYTRPCDRCSSVTTKLLDYTFKHTLVVSLSGDSNDNFVETPDYKLDLDELITSDVILELPSKYLCDEDCKGLCFKCGANKNSELCNCETKVIDPRFEVLKELLN